MRRLRTALTVAFLGVVASVASFVLLPWGDGYELEGSPTASGRAFDPERYTAAHRTLPLGELRR